MNRLEARRQNLTVALKARWPKSDLERFAEKVDRSGGPDACWLWLAGKERHAYGRFYLLGRNRRAHRAAYELLVGPIPEGLQLDHLCRNHGCVNPAHLEPVTNATNSRRGAPHTKTHCVNGHEYTPENTRRRSVGEKRACRACVRDHSRLYRAQRKDRRAAA